MHPHLPRTAAALPNHSAPPWEAGTPAPDTQEGKKKKKKREKRRKVRSRCCEGRQKGAGAGGRVPWDLGRSRQGHGMVGRDLRRS